ncbi:MAG: endonuclease [Saprospirales bacterium]|nr:endonuclease [Saprospirales bacterium]
MPSGQSTPMKMCREEISFYGEYIGPLVPSAALGRCSPECNIPGHRYNGLEVVDGYPEGQIGQFGDLATLLEWHRNDPPDDYEMNRNNVVYSWQLNRNPFIDLPDLVEYIWGDSIGYTWQQPLSTGAANPKPVGIFPNPAKTQVHITRHTGALSGGDPQLAGADTVQSAGVGRY